MEGHPLPSASTPFLESPLLCPVPEPEEQFRVLREKGTERPGTGQYDKFDKAGIYDCAGCGTPLYQSRTKFNVRFESILFYNVLISQSGCGWPAFFDGT